MSAKDPRRTIQLRVPEGLRPALRRVRARRRCSSTAGALRLLVLAGLSRPALSDGPLTAMPQPDHGRVLRLQLDRASRARIESLAAAKGVSLAACVLAVAAYGAATMPQDEPGSGPLSFPD